LTPEGVAAVCATDGEDLGGHSALTLLTSAPASATILFIVSPGRAVVARGAGDKQLLSSCEIADALRLPFAEGTFDAVVMRSYAAAGKEGPATERCLNALREVHRVLKTNGQCLLVAASTRVPADRRNWREYRLEPPLKIWSRAVQRSPMASGRAFDVRYQGVRIVELGLGADSSHSSGFNACALVLTKGGASSPRAQIEEIPAAAAREIDDAGRTRPIGPCLVRKIGKTAVFGSLENGMSYVARIPRSPVALKRARTNYEGLSRIRDSSFASGWKRLIPRPLAHGCLNGYEYFVEELAVGSAKGDADPDAPYREEQAIRFVTEFHLTTAKRVTIDSRRYAQLIGEPISRIAAMCPASAELARLDNFLNRSLLHRTIPLVWSHGDFALGNCLYDDDGELSGVIDWELFSTAGLPLLDVVHRLDIPNESSSFPTWQRFDRTLRMLRESAWQRSPVVSAYVARLEVPPDVVPALLVMHWVHHVAQRIVARGGDPVWLQKRVLHPLHQLGAWLQPGILSDAPVQRSVQ
jgi:hypothetical protein